MLICRNGIDGVDGYLIVFHSLSSLSGLSDRGYKRSHSNPRLMMSMIEAYLPQPSFLPIGTVVLQRRNTDGT